MTYMQLFALLTSLGAAIFWGWSATIAVPPLMGTKLEGKDSITGIMQRQSRYSAIGAALAAVSVIFQAFA